jgi:hypothetical protein
MGYSYGRNAAGNMVLACDGCGVAGGVRKRACPHRVLDAADTRGGPRRSLAYCPAPAYCDACYAEHGPAARLHAKCAEGAAYMQGIEDRKQAALDAGDACVSAAWGDWAEGVPAGMVRVAFRGYDGVTHQLMPAAEYDPGARPFMSDYAAVLAAA